MAGKGTFDVEIETLRRQLGKYKRVFLDTILFIYLVERNPTYSALAETVLESVETGKLEAFISSLTLAELLTGPAQAQNVEAMRDYELYLTHFPHLNIIAVGPEHAPAIARARAVTGLRASDAIQIALAIVTAVDAIIGNDKAWKGKTGAIDYVMLRSFR